MTSAKRLRVGILFGGRSGEHEVSLASAASVIRALNPEKYEAVPIGIAKDGRWLVGGGALKLLADVLKSGDRVVLPPDPTAGSLVPLGGGSGQSSVSVDVIFPVLHGTFGEDGTVQGLLDLAGIPYVGAGVLGSAIGMDKDAQKRLLASASIPVVRYFALTSSDYQRKPALARRYANDLGYPVFVKPNALGSSIGITRVTSARKLTSALADAFP